MKKIDEVSVELKTNVYSTFRALTSTVYHTLSEFIDNAVQSYRDHKHELITLEKNYKLVIKVSIDVHKHVIKVEDNAAGIDSANYVRAFEPANLPPNTKGLNEFGMGMKTAAVWLADTWTVTTKALNENVERITTFDLNDVIKHQSTKIAVKERFVPAKQHYTKIELTNLFGPHEPTNQKIDHIKKYIASIHRQILRNGEVEIEVNGQKLSPPKYEILNAPYYDDKSGKNILWKKEIDLELGTHSIKGFVGLLKKIKNGTNGFILTRRGRVIVGAEDNRYMPECIFGKTPGTFRYKRIFGELELNGFSVSFNKNAVLDDSDLDAVMQLLKIELSSKDFNFLAQADKYRQKTKEECETLSSKIMKKLAKDDVPEPVLSRKLKSLQKEFEKPRFNRTEEKKIRESNVFASQTKTFDLDDKKKCLLKIETTQSESTHLYALLSENASKEEKKEGISIVYICKINLTHPFFSQFEKIKTADDYLPIVTIFQMLAMAEIMTMDKKVGILKSSTIRSLFNNLITQWGE